MGGLLEDLRGMTGLDHVGRTAHRAANEIERLQDIVDAYRADPPLYTRADVSQMVARMTGLQAALERIQSALIARRSGYMARELNRTKCMSDSEIEAVISAAISLESKS